MVASVTVVMRPDSMSGDEGRYDGIVILETQPNWDYKDPGSVFKFRLSIEPSDCSCHLYVWPYRRHQVLVHYMMREDRVFTDYPEAVNRLLNPICLAVHVGKMAAERPGYSGAPFNEAPFCAFDIKLLPVSIRRPATCKLSTGLALKDGRIIYAWLKGLNAEVPAPA